MPPDDTVTDIPSTSGEIKVEEIKTDTPTTSAEVKVEEVKKETNIRVCQTCKKEGWFKSDSFPDGEKKDKLCYLLDKNFAHLECMPSRKP